MKKLVLFFAVAAGAIITSCDPPQNCWGWWVKNNTEQTLKLGYLDYSYSRNTSSWETSFRTSMVFPGDSIMLYRSCFEEKKRLTFDNYFENCVNSYGEDAAWQILNEEAEVLKTWSYSDKDLPDLRFFEESSWYFTTKPGAGAFISMEYSWIFNILPEDIQLTN